MKLWLILFANPVGASYDSTNGAIVRAASADEAWYTLRDSVDEDGRRRYYSANLHFRHQYNITEVTSEGGPEIILVDYHEG